MSMQFCSVVQESKARVAQLEGQAAASAQQLAAKQAELMAVQGELAVAQHMGQVIGFCVYWLLMLALIGQSCKFVHVQDWAHD